MKKVKDGKYIGKRFMAYIIDWYFGSVVAMIPFLVIAMANNVAYNDVLNLAQYTMTEIITGVLISLVSSFLYFFILPWKIYPGQTIGKKIMKLKITNDKNEELTTTNLFIRQIICIWFVEISLHSIGGILLNTLVNIIPVDILFVIKDINIWVVVFSAIMLLITYRHISLHDWIAKTKVIDVKY